MPPGRHVPQECHYTGGGGGEGGEDIMNSQPARTCVLLRSRLSGFCDINFAMYISELGTILDAGYHLLVITPRILRT